MTRAALTPTEKRFVDFIVAYWRKHGYPPLAKQLGAVLGRGKWHGAVYPTTRRCVRKGYLTWNGSNVRTIKPVEVRT